MAAAGSVRPTSEYPMAPVSDRSLRGKRILVVDDEALVALDLQATLEDGGAMVVGPFHGLRGAMRAAASDEPLDAAILDVDLGDDSVFPLADRLIDGGVPFVFHTGRSDLDRLHHRYGDVVVLLKPSRPEDVTYHLGGVIAAAHAARAARG